MRIGQLCGTSLFVPTLMALASGCVSAPPELDDSPNAVTTFDGLVSVRNVGQRKVYVRPGFDINGYPKLLYVGAGVSYQPAKPGRSFSKPLASTSNADTQFAISPENRERLEAIVSIEFKRELVQVKGFDIVSEPGPGTLSLEIRLLDVVSRVPPSKGLGEIYLSEVGEATLLLELRDAQANQTLIRTVQRRKAGNPGGLNEFSVPANSASNWAEVKRLAASWARQMRAGLEELANSDE